MTDQPESDPSQVLRLREGWYLMSVADLEVELARRRGEIRPPSNAERLSVADALAFRDAGNVPDELGRSLRLVLVVDGDSAAALHEQRLRWEPDFHDAPEWRRPGSVPVNVVPLREGREEGSADDAWWDDPELARMEDEWARTGSVDGLAIPAEYRGFLYKTIISLRSSGRPVTVESVSDSVARWLEPDQASALRAALQAANG
jgi:hypothetical protein